MTSAVLALTVLTVVTLDSLADSFLNDPHPSNGLQFETGPKKKCPTSAPGQADFPSYDVSMSGSWTKYFFKDVGGSAPCPPVPCPKCDPDKCQLPNCKCSNFTIPGKVPRGDTPQIVIVTMQNAVTNVTYPAFLSLFEGLRNPNKCPATGTYFVSHAFTDYFLVQSLRTKGHEIGDNSVTSDSNPAEYWKNANESTWTREIEDQISILNRYANVTSVRGFRAPYLQPGGDTQMSAFSSLKSKISYDSTLVTVKYSKRKGEDGLLWPYTYDYRSIQDCVTPQCPVQCYPGFWEIPLLAFWDSSNRACALLDSCNVTTYNDVFRLLYDRFAAHYDDNRAPLIISMRPQWLMTGYQLQGIKLFLRYLSGYEDVYIVSAGQALDWIKNPTPVSKLNDFKPWKCDQPPPPVCQVSETTTCHYDKNRRPTSPGSAFYNLRMCSAVGKCPSCYPWLGDVQGTGCHSEDDRSGPEKK